MPSGIRPARRSVDGRRQRRKAIPVVHRASPAHRATEVHQAVAAQDQSADMAIVAIARIFEAEAAFENPAAGLPPTQAQAIGVDGLVEPLHARCPAGIAPNLFGSLSGATGGAP